VSCRLTGRNRLLRIAVASLHYFRLWWGCTRRWRPSPAEDLNPPRSFWTLIEGALQVSGYARCWLSRALPCDIAMYWARLAFSCQRGDETSRVRRPIAARVFMGGSKLADGYVWNVRSVCGGFQATFAHLSPETESWFPQRQTSHDVASSGRCCLPRHECLTRAKRSFRDNGLHFILATQQQTPNHFLLPFLPPPSTPLLTLTSHLCTRFSNTSVPHTSACPVSPAERWYKHHAPACRRRQHPFWCQSQGRLTVHQPSPIHTTTRITIFTSRGSSQHTRSSGSREVRRVRTVSDAHATSFASLSPSAPHIHPHYTTCVINTCPAGQHSHALPPSCFPFTPLLIPLATPFHFFQPTSTSTSTFLAFPPHHHHQASAHQHLRLLTPLQLACIIVKHSWQLHTGQTSQPTSHLVCIFSVDMSEVHH